MNRQCSWKKTQIEKKIICWDLEKRVNLVNFHGRLLLKVWIYHVVSLKLSSMLWFRHTQLREPESYFQKLSWNTSYDKNLVGDPLFSIPHWHYPVACHPHFDSLFFPAIEPVLPTHTVITTILTNNPSVTLANEVRIIRPMNKRVLRESARPWSFPVFSKYGQAARAQHYFDVSLLSRYMAWELTWLPHGQLWAITEVTASLTP